MESALIRESRLLAEQIFAEEVFQRKPYHNIRHTRDVVDAVKEIGIHEGLTDEELEACIAAAWLHDIGHKVAPEDHEQRAIAMAGELFNHIRTPVGTITMVTNAILATRMPQKPRSLVEQVLCDADLAYLASPRFRDIGNLLRAEMALGGRRFTEEEWRDFNLDFIRNHQYHTTYGQQVMEANKQKNAKRLQASNEAPDNEEVSPRKYRKLKEKLQRLEEMNGHPEQTPHIDRSLDITLSRTVHHYILRGRGIEASANTLILISGIMLSAWVMSCIAVPANHNDLIYPLMLASVACVATIACAVLANRPLKAQGKTTKTDALNPDRFTSGNFDDFASAIERMANNKDLHQLLLREVYDHGRNLSIRSRYLRTAYAIFVMGIATAIGWFGIALLSGH